MKIKYLINLSTSINLIMIVIKLYGVLMTEIAKLIKQKDSDACTPALKRRGRPKCFDEQHALEQATLLFWQYGYEATSIGDLTKAMGITAPSLYSTFGDKEQLFKKCLAYYQEHETCQMDSIVLEAETIRQGIYNYLQSSMRHIVQENKPTGCMYVISTMNCSNDHHQLQQQIIAQRQQKKQKIESYLSKAQELNELPSSADIPMLADFFATMLQGMSIQARDGADLNQLQKVLDLSMQVWDR